jgi:AraC-like DNA-binding protein
VVTIAPANSAPSTATRKRVAVSDARMLADLESHGFNALGIIELFDRFETAGFWIKDRKGRFVWVNTMFLLHFGLHHRTDVLGRTDFELCEPSLAAQYQLDDEMVLKGKRIISRIEMVGRFDHSMRWVITTKIPVYSRRGQIVGTAGVSQPYEKDEPGMVSGSPLAEAMKFLAENFNEPFDRRKLAKQSGMSLRDFHRKFREAYHVTPHDYVRQLRVRASCNALVFSDKTLARIASEYGFSDQSHFTREFHRAIGEPPGVYRARHQR